MEALIFIFLLSSVCLVQSDDNVAMESGVNYQVSYKLPPETHEPEASQQIGHAQSYHAISQTFGKNLVTTVKEAQHSEQNQYSGNGGNGLGYSHVQSGHRDSSPDNYGHVAQNEIHESTQTATHQHPEYASPQQQVYLHQYPHHQVIRVYGAEASPHRQTEGSAHGVKTSGFTSFVEHYSNKEDAEEIKSALKEGSLNDIKRLVPKSGVSFKIFHNDKPSSLHSKTRTHSNYESSLSLNSGHHSGVSHSNAVVHTSNTLVPATGHGQNLQTVVSSSHVGVHGISPEVGDSAGQHSLKTVVPAIQVNHELGHHGSELQHTHQTVSSGAHLQGHEISQSYGHQGATLGLSAIKTELPAPQLQSQEFSHGGHQGIKLEVQQVPVHHVQTQVVKNELGHYNSELGHSGLQHSINTHLSEAHLQLHGPQTLKNYPPTQIQEVSHDLRHQSVGLEHSGLQQVIKAQSPPPQLQVQSVSHEYGHHSAQIGVSGQQKATKTELPTSYLHVHGPRHELKHQGGIKVQHKIPQTHVKVPTHELGQLKLRESKQIYLKNQNLDHQNLENAEHTLQSVKVHGLYKLKPEVISQEQEIHGKASSFTNLQLKEENFKKAISTSEFNRNVKSRKPEIHKESFKQDLAGGHYKTGWNSPGGAIRVEIPHKEELTKPVREPLESYHETSQYVNNELSESSQNFDHQKALEGSTSFDIKNAIGNTNVLLHQTTGFVHPGFEIQAQVHQSSLPVNGHSLTYLVPKLPVLPTPATVAIESNVLKTPLQFPKVNQDALVSTSEFAYPAVSTPVINGKFFSQPQTAWTSEHLKLGNALTTNDMHQSLIRLHLPKNEGVLHHLKPHSDTTVLTSYAQKHQYSVPFVKFAQDVQFHPKKPFFQHQKLVLPQNLEWNHHKTEFPAINLNKIVIKPEMMSLIQEPGKKIIPILVKKRKNRSHKEVGVVYGKVTGNRGPVRPNHRQDKTITMNLLPQPSNIASQFEKPKSDRKNEFSVSASYRVDRSFQNDGKA